MNRIITRNNAVLFTLLYVVSLVVLAWHDWQLHHDLEPILDSSYWLVIMSGFTWHYIHRSKPNEKSTFLNLVYLGVILLCSLFFIDSIQAVLFALVNRGVHDPLILEARQQDWDNFAGFYVFGGLAVGFMIFTFLGGKYIESK